MSAWSNTTFDECARRVVLQPEQYESYRCYYEVASRTGEWRAADRHLIALERQRPQIVWVVFVRGLVNSPFDKQRAEQLYAEAAQRFQETDNDRGEVLARANLQTLLFDSGRIASAGRQVERITAIANDADNPELRIRARVVEAQFFIGNGSNLGRAQRALLQADAELEESPSYWLQHHVLHGLGRTALLTGEYDAAVTHFRRLEEVAREQQDLSTVARARFDTVNATLEKRTEAPHSVDASLLLADAETALAAAQRAQELDLELVSLRLLGEVMIDASDARADQYLQQCVAKAEQHGRSRFLSQCLWIQARRLAATDPAAAQRAKNRAIDLLEHEEGTDPSTLAFAWRYAMRIAWEIEPPDQAIRQGMQALTAMEYLRSRQPDFDERAAAFSIWVQDYHWLSGQILRLAETLGIDPEQRRALIEQAFEVGERMRARSLLDRLRSRGVTVMDQDVAKQARRNDVLKALVAVNRKLLQSTSADESELQDELARLEREEAELRSMKWDLAPQLTSPVTLREVKARVASDEALLIYQIGLRSGSADAFAGGSWVYVVTTDSVSVHELPDRYALESSLSLVGGLLRKPDAQRSRASAALYRQLLRPALESLPASIKRLTIVPDSPLDTFPLAVLSDGDRAQSLAQRFELVWVPSATIWHEWRSRSNPESARPVLVLADPQLEYSMDAVAETRSWSKESLGRLGRLPHARDEGYEILRQLPDGGVLWAGAEASEAALKSKDLTHFGVLHFATHTIVDNTRADRSAILLASGNEDQDGLLQSREIAELKLDSPVVVLSSCQSATGRAVRGEGVLGVARSFFAAGARVVIGSLWPMRDDYARAFFEPFYESIAAGDSVAVAFHRAQRTLIDAGLPVEAWAGFILMGDADATLVTEPKTRFGLVALTIVTGLIVLAFAVAYSIRVTRRSS